MTVAWSFGGGVQSAAIAALIARGDLPRPDLAVIADTGREAETTWAYLKQVVAPALSPLGVCIEIAEHSLATVDLYSANGTLLIPAYTGEAGGEREGQLPGYCSVEWKRRVVRRWLRARNVRDCELWLGISLDEAGRAKGADVGWIEHRFPLIERHLRRADCLRLVAEAGWPAAPKSSCWMCPYRGPKEWAALTSGDRERASRFDAEIRERDPKVYLRRDLRPLEAVEPAPAGPDLPLFGEVAHCDSGYCWT